MNFIRDLFSPVLSDRTIKKYMKDSLLIESRIDPKQIQPNSVDLTLGYTAKTLKHNCMLNRSSDGKYESIPIVDIQMECVYESSAFLNHIIIPSHGFMLLASNEILNIPNGILGFVQGRSSVARLGIQTEPAGLIDAGFRGIITFEVFNETEYPIVLYPGMRIAQVYFFRAQKSDVAYGIAKGSKYSDQIDATGSKIFLDFMK